MKAQQFSGMGRSDCFPFLPPTAHALEVPTPGTESSQDIHTNLEGCGFWGVMFSLAESLSERPCDKSTCLGTKPTWV